MPTSPAPTPVEYFLMPHEVLVSTSDLAGRITYCSPEFVAVSGFSMNELLGAPHSLLRHPDMPRALFRELWATIGTGARWSALIKNRRKNGAFYWAMLRVTPLLDAGAPLGYLALQTAPTAEQRHTAALSYPTGPY